MLAEADDQFGHALAVADFDADGFADLAVGVVGEDIGALASAGAVNLLPGSAAGLTAAGDQFWQQDSAGVLGVAAAGDQFGDALAAGDFDADGFADLAVGVFGENQAALFDVGAVNILPGSAAGLTAAGDQRWYPGQPRHPGDGRERRSLRELLEKTAFRSRPDSRRRRTGSGP